MTPAARLRRLLPLLVATFVASPSAAAENRDLSPNILVLIADDLGWNDVGYHGSDIKTPVLDRLAAGGIRFERHYVCPTCSPTRCGLLTGRNPSRFNIQGPIADRSELSLPAETPTLSMLLKKKGYATALFGKWHLGLRPEVGPRRYGFEQTYGYFHGQIDQFTHRYKNGDRTWHRNDEFVDEKGHATDLIAGEAVRFLEAKRNSPFFLWVAFSVPHHPVQEEEKWLNPYKESIKDESRRLYAASVSHMDAAIGRIVDALRERGELDNTIILFTSDNGGQRDYQSKTEYEGKHGPYPTLGSNKPLRGWKGELYEGGIRVPALVNWPGKFKPRAVEQAVSYLDWFPTFAGLAGAKVEPVWKLDGRDVSPLLMGEKKEFAPGTLYWNTGSQAGILQGDWKLIVPLRKNARSKQVELYDLKSDPAEEKNLAADMPGKVKELQKALAEQQALDRESGK